MITRLKPNAPPLELIEENKSMIKKYLSGDRALMQKAEKAFHDLFEEFKAVNHNDQFHGTETLLYHQYMVLHSFDKFIDVVVRDFSDDDKFVGHMEMLLQTVETKTRFGRRELRTLLTHVPPRCTKNLQTLLFLTVLFHDLGKLYNTEKWEQEFEDETLKLRKFQRHDMYGRSFFRFLMVRKSRLDQILDNIIGRTKEEKAKLSSLLEGMNEKKRKKQEQKIHLLEIDIYYLTKCRDVIKQFKDLLDEFDLKTGDYRFIANLVEHHQTLLNDPTMNYVIYANEKDIKKLQKFLKWARDKKLAKVGILRKNLSNDFVFYGLMFVNMADAGGTGFSDHAVEIAFKKYKKGDKFKGHHGDIGSDAEFCGFLVYLYHNLSRSDDEIIKDWFGVEEKKKEVQYNWGALFKSYPKEDALNIKLTLQKKGPKGLAALAKTKGWNMGQIMKLIRV